MENLEKQLVCPVCLEMFSKPVVILPCQHNLCRKCANDILQAASPLYQARGSGGVTGSGGRFRCPSCRHEVVLDRHGVFGLQRNLLVENIIDIYRQQSSRSVSVKPGPRAQQVMCEEHQDERINIYCLCCQTPTCSMCKVFGRHKDCEVAPLGSVYVKRKTELSDGIAVLVATNDHVQALICQLEDICRSIEENGQRQREQLSARFQGLVTVLEERKQELVGLITKHQDDKLRLVRSLIRRHGERLEEAVTLVESAIQSMDEPHMSLFIQTAKDILKKMALTGRTSTLERLELDFENMSGFMIDTDELLEMLRNIDFCSVSRNDDDEDDEEENESDPDCPRF